MTHLLPEQEARQKIDQQLTAASWDVQDLDTTGLLQMATCSRKAGHFAFEPKTPLFFDNNLIRIRFVDTARPAFAALQVNSRPFREVMEGAKRATTSGAAVYSKDLLPMPIALPALTEQHQIVAEVESRTTAIDHLEAELDQQLDRSKRLRQSILSSAFSGNL